VEGARPTDDEQPVIALFDDVYCSFTAAEDCGEGSRRGGQLRGEELRRDEGIVAEDCVSRVLIRNRNEWHIFDIWAMGGILRTSSLTSWRCCSIAMTRTVGTLTCSKMRLLELIGKG